MNLKKRNKWTVKKGIAVFLAVSLILSFGGCSTDPLESETVNAIQDLGVLRIGVYSDATGFSKLENGQYNGLEAELARRIGTVIMGNVNSVELVTVNERSRLHKLDDGSIDMSIAMLTYSSDKEAKYAGSQPYFTDTYAFLTRSDTYTSLEQLEGKRVGVIYGSGLKTTLETFMESNQISFTLVDIASYPEAIEQLYATTTDENGATSLRLDALCAQQAYLENYLADGLHLLPTGFGEVEYSVLCRKEKQELVQVADSVLEEMQESGELATLIANLGL